MNWERIEPVLAGKPDDSTLKIVVQAVFQPLLAMRICTVDELITEIKKRYNDGDGGEYTKQNLLEDEYRVFCIPEKVPP